MKHIFKFIQLPEGILPIIIDKSLSSQFVEISDITALEH